MKSYRAHFNPATNPGVLDTWTWNPQAAVKQCEHQGKFFLELVEAMKTAHCNGCVRSAISGNNAVVLPSARFKNGVGYFMLTLDDGQEVIVAASSRVPDVPVNAIGWLARGKVAIIAVDTETVKWYVTNVAMDGPKAFGAVPRLGIGARQTVTAWPGIIDGLRRIGGPAETVQNSAYRELAPMEMILAPPGKEVTYLPGHGSLSIGHTGSSIQGFWLAGVLAHLENGCSEPYGADLDHVPVKSADESGMAKAKYLIECGKHFTFFTLDTSFLFDFATSDLSQRYGLAIDAAVEIYKHIKGLKREEPFDFEFSLDEGPEITQPEELRFVLEELTKRGAPPAFIAPNVGFEKRVDYRRPDGLPALEARVREMSQVAADYGVLLDFHSGSDKSSETYRTIARAADGKLKLKVSGKLQLLLGEVVADVDPEFFNEWWDYTLATAKAEAEAGSEVAKEYLDILEHRRASEGQDFRRSPKDRFFTDFSFGMVGAKDDNGAFLYRERFYSLKPAVQEEYTKRIADYVVQLAEDLNLRRK